MTRNTLIACSVAALLAMPALAESRTYELGSFDKIDASDVIEVEYVQGASHSVIVEQEDGDFDGIIVENKNGTLVLKRPKPKNKNLFGWGGNNVSINIDDGKRRVRINGKKAPWYLVRVTAPDVNELDASSNAMVTARDLNLARLEASASSSGEVTLFGTAGSAILSASSSGDVEAGAFNAQDLDISVSSSGDVIAMATGGRVDISASSGSDAEVSGGCFELQVNASSGADVDAQDLACSTARLTASSGADIEANVSDSVVARASSGGDIDVAGDPVDSDVTESSGGDVSISG